MNITFVNLSNDKWCIMSTGERTRELLTNHIWYCAEGYIKTSINKSKIRYHRMLMNLPNNMVVDHINIKTFDNRLENLRIVTVKENNRNRTKQHNNTSGIVRVYKRRNTWIARIYDNDNHRITKSFTFNKNCTYEQAKQLAIEQRIAWKEPFGYIGE